DQSVKLRVSQPFAVKVRRRGKNDENGHEPHEMTEEDAERICSDQARERSARMVNRIEVADNAEECTGNRDGCQDSAAAHERLEQHQECAKSAPNKFRQYEQQI